MMGPQEPLMGGEGGAALAPGTGSATPAHASAVQGLLELVSSSPASAGRFTWSGPISDAAMGADPAGLCATAPAGACALQHRPAADPRLIPAHGAVAHGPAPTTTSRAPVTFDSMPSLESLATYILFPGAHAGWRRSGH
jgi:hypothetical protein